MFSGTNKYLFFLVVIIVLLPAAIFALFELSRLQQNENVIEEAYNEQLNAILFSVNQYSDDVLTSTIRDIDFSLREGDATLPPILSNYSFIKEFFFLDSGLPDSTAINTGLAETIKKKANQIKTEKENTLTRLKQFYEVGYFRLEPFPIENTGHVLFVFIVRKENRLQPAAIIVDALAFINEQVGPQIQKISTDKFSIVILDKSDKPVFSSARDSTISHIELTNPIQAFSEFTLGIALQGDTVGELVKQRTNTNIYFVCIVSFILLIAGWLVIRIFRKQIELANLKSDFVSSVSHEIRTPLSLINMYAETIEMGRVDSPELQKEYIKIILQEINRLSILVNKILNFSQIEKNKKKYEFTNSNLNDIVAETFNGYTPYLEKLGFKYKTEFDKRVPDIKLDAEAVKDVLVNLLDNAIKYSFDKKLVTVSTGLYVNMVFFEVEDSGIGISEKDKKNIFDKFYRVSRDDVSVKVKGSGLGLSIVRHIVDAHNGKIEIKSKVGKGCTFRILFPLNN